MGGREIGREGGRTLWEQLTAPLHPTVLLCYYQHMAFVCVSANQGKTDHLHVAQRSPLCSAPLLATGAFSKGELSLPVRVCVCVGSRRNIQMHFQHTSRVEPPTAGCCSNINRGPKLCSPSGCGRSRPLSCPPIPDPAASSPGN